jgi:hypothetical protein
MPDESSSTRPAQLVVGLGELIWDMFPEGRRLGGAPSNFAYISRLLGNAAAVSTVYPSASRLKRRPSARCFSSSTMRIVLNSLKPSEVG